MSGALRIERVLTEGTFALDGGEWNVDNNIWLIGDDTDVVIVDAAHAAQPIIDAVGDRHVNAVICTHGHNDHVTVAPELGTRLHAPVLLHPGDDVLWKMSHPEELYWHLEDEQRIAIAGTEIQVIHSPGHSPGSVCLYLPRPGHCSPATPCSRVAPAPRAGRTRISRPSSVDPRPVVRSSRRNARPHRSR